MLLRVGVLPESKCIRPNRHSDQSGPDRVCQAPLRGQCLRVPGGTARFFDPHVVGGFQHKAHVTPVIEETNLASLLQLMCLTRCSLLGIGIIGIGASVSSASLERLKSRWLSSNGLCLVIVHLVMIVDGKSFKSLKAEQFVCCFVTNYSPVFSTTQERRQFTPPHLAIIHRDFRFTVMPFQHDATIFTLRPLRTLSAVEVQIVLVQRHEPALIQRDVWLTQGQDLTSLLKKDDAWKSISWRRTLAFVTLGSGHLSSRDLVTFPKDEYCLLN